MNKHELHRQIEKEIMDYKVSERHVSRKGLKKYLGVVTEFTCTFEKQNDTHSSSLVLDVRVHNKNKILAEHIWINTRHNYEQGTKLRFKGVVGTYTDKFGERKYRLAVIKNKMERI